MSDTGLIKPNPAAYRPPPPPPQPVPVGEVRRFVPADIDQWLLSRVSDRWAEFSEATWRNRLASIAVSNGFLFVTNERCVLLMTAMGSHAMTGKPIVMEVFAFSRDARWSEDVSNWVIDPKKTADGITAMSAIYRAGKNWMKGMSATRMIVGTCSDMAPSVIKNAAGGYYVVDVVNR